MHYKTDTAVVSPSGTVGKVVFTAEQKRNVHGVVLTPGSASAAFVQLSHGLTSAGTEAVSLRAPANESVTVMLGCQHFGRGAHVRVTGAGAKAFLLYS